MADVVLNSLGIQTWENSFASIGLNGRWVTFGGLTGADVKLNVQSLYSKQIKLIGCTGGTRKEMTEVIDMSKELKTRVWKKFTVNVTTIRQVHYRICTILDRYLSFRNLLV
jgi:NADPH:quinone reductase-like Zn-dependent oxidoreductase